MRPACRRLLWGVGIGVAILAVVVIRVAVGSCAAYDHGVALEEQGQAELAALEYRQAISWYFPGNPWASDAIERMWALADAAQQKNDFVGARIIVSDLRGALYGIRHVAQPHQEELALCNKRLADLLAHTDERVLGGKMSVETVRPRYSEDVERDHAPSVPWALALGLGFLGWILATFTALKRLSKKSAPPKGLRWKAALPWFAVSIVFLATWLAGAALA